MSGNRIAGFRLTTRRAAMVEAHIYVISGTIAQWYFSKDDARVKQHTAFSKSEERLRILDAYRTGKGCVVVRGKTEIEISDSKTKSAAIVVKEIPYQNNKSSLVMKNAENKVSSFFIPIYVFIHAISFYVPL
ncbi:putative DNA topoisomerase (ATP-hydrolyzing) [Helianthus annuus]|uniref:DNA topoisomerase (ATP-hydrolyzing) n=1 Tax=Helianthus annuus TaxID=4232 RepID=A0A251VMF6_HELAN|nr:putative DNA topoisomerase (ATP-hydrolyzing) [Helianthus annuus]